MKFSRDQVEVLIRAGNICLAYSAVIADLSETLGWTEKTRAVFKTLNKRQGELEKRYRKLREKSHA